MKLRRSIVYALLSLLLLLSQQIAVSHVYSHWPSLSAQLQQAGLAPDQGARADAGAASFKLRQQWQDDDADGDDTGQSIGSQHDCAQCHAVAQIAFAVYSSFLALAPDASSFTAVAAPITFIACLVTVCVFQSRAPPVA